MALQACPAFGVYRAFFQFRSDALKLAAVKTHARLCGLGTKPRREGPHLQGMLALVHGKKRLPAGSRSGCSCGEAFELISTNW